MQCLNAKDVAIEVLNKEWGKEHFVDRLSYLVKIELEKLNYSCSESKNHSFKVYLCVKENTKDSVLVAYMQLEEITLKIYPTDGFIMITPWIYVVTDGKSAEASLYFTVYIDYNDDGNRNKPYVYAYKSIKLDPTNLNPLYTDHEYCFDEENLFCKDEHLLDVLNYIKRKMVEKREHQYT